MSPSLPVPQLRTADFDFALPDALIAQSPARPRDAARLLLVRPGQPPADRGVRDLPDLLSPGDLLVVNDTKVIPARLRARRGAAALEILLNRREADGTWQALVRNARRLRPGDTVTIGEDEGQARVVERLPDGTVRLDFGPDEAAFATLLDRAGEIPLPPYILRPEGPRPEDLADYQPIFAARPGAVAAPTASLHFTDPLLAALEARGIGRVQVTLHVGAGTFLPMRGDDPREHRLHAEWGEVSPEAAAIINAARAAGRRIVAVGTTALRLLESAASGEGVRPFQGLTDLFLLPGHRFRTADALLTNFHLPRSTLFMLVCAFSGTETMRAAYAHAVGVGYRFYSYGDASLLFRAPDAC